MVVLISCLQNFPCDKLMAGLTLHAKMDLVVFLTVRRTILADVLPAQHFPTGLALETAEVPLVVQGQKSLTVLYIPATSCTVTRGTDVFGSRGSWLDAMLAETVFSIKRDSITSGKWPFANSADKTCGMVSLPKSSDHLSFNKVSTAITASAMKPLVVQCA